MQMYSECRFDLNKFLIAYYFIESFMVIQSIITNLALHSHLCNRYVFCLKLPITYFKYFIVFFTINQYNNQLNVLIRFIHIICKSYIKVGMKYFHLNQIHYKQVLQLRDVYKFKIKKIQRFQYNVALLKLIKSPNVIKHKTRRVKLYYNFFTAV